MLRSALWRLARAGLDVSVPGTLPTGLLVSCGLGACRRVSGDHGAALVAELNAELSDLFGEPPASAYQQPRRWPAQEPLASHPALQQQLAQQQQQQEQQQEQQEQQEQQQQQQHLPAVLLHQLLATTARLQTELAAVQATLQQLCRSASDSPLGSPSQASTGSPAVPPRLTHVDSSGRASMVDVGGKHPSARSATASCIVRLGPQAYAAVAVNAVSKGDVLTLAQVAGIQGAKAASSLIPLCHSLLLSSVDVRVSLQEEQHCLLVSATARSTGQTGVEMEALTAAAVAGLTAYDMCKGVSKAISIERLRLDAKEGGKSGPWARDPADTLDAL